MNISQREPEGDTAPVLTFNIEIHHHGKSALSKQVLTTPFLLCRLCHAPDMPTITRVRIRQVADARQKTNGRSNAILAGSLRGMSLRPQKRRPSAPFVSA